MHQAALVALLDAIDEGAIVFDRSGKCVFAGARVGELFGVDVAAMVGGPEDDVLRLLASACEEPDAWIERARPDGKTPRTVSEIELRRPRMRTAHWSATAIVDGSTIAGWIGVVRDVTRERSAERRVAQLQKRLDAITATDALTQLPNKRRFDEELEREHGRAARAWDSYAILRIDVDGMGALNEELGRARGDEVLEEVAKRANSGRREYDVIARLADDELVVLLPGADAHAARVVAQRMADAVSKDAFPAGATVTVSIGAAVWIPPSGEVGVDVVTRAGVALVDAKAKGAATIVIDAEQKDSKP